MTDNAGIYAIENVLDRRAYVGATKRGFRQRWRNHCVTLQSGKHQSTVLQADWTRHGPGYFKFVPLEVLSTREAFAAREQYWIDHLRDLGYLCYNVAPAYENSRRFPGPVYAHEFYSHLVVARILHLSAPKMEELLRLGKVRGLRFGRRWRISHAELKRLRPPIRQPVIPFGPHNE